MKTIYEKSWFPEEGKNRGGTSYFDVEDWGSGSLSFEINEGDSTSAILTIDEVVQLQEALTQWLVRQK